MQNIFLILWLVPSVVILLKKKRARRWELVFFNTVCLYPILLLTYVRPGTEYVFVPVWVVLFAVSLAE